MANKKTKMNPIHILSKKEKTQIEKQLQQLISTSQVIQIIAVKYLHIIKNRILLLLKLSNMRVTHL